VIFYRGWKEAAITGRRWTWILGAVILLGVVAGVGNYEVWRLRRELELARQEIDRKAWVSAGPRLRSLARWPLGWGGDEVDYLLGLCEWQSGRRQSAVEAFRRVPAGSRFETPAVSFIAEDLLMQWRFRAAEERLQSVLKPGRKGRSTARAMMVRLGRMQARFDEVRTWLRDGFAEADDPIGLLRQLWVLDRGVAPSEGLRENLDKAYSVNPEDDRVWLGLGRVAILEGDFDRAARWLTRCRDLRPDDLAVKRAWLDLARAAGRANEAARFLDGSLWVELDAAEQLAWESWLARHLGSEEEERHSVERWLEKEPQKPEALERLGTLAARTGDIKLSDNLRRRKGEVDDSLDRYRTRISSPVPFATVADRLEMARLAEQAGRPFDARAWCTLASRLDAQAPELAPIVSRLDSALANLGKLSPPSSRPHYLEEARPGSSKSFDPRARIEFRDDAEAVGLRFTFQNGETVIHQIPETMSGGLGLLDYDGDGWLDVYCPQGGIFPPDSSRSRGGDRLFHNRGDGTFEDATESTGIAGLSRGYGHGVAVGDYDNDGNTDLFLTRWRAYCLFRNKGDGTFEDATKSTGLSGDRDWPTSAAFADLDGDGDLDLYVCHYLKWDPDNPKVCQDSQTRSYVSCNPRDFPALPDHVFRNDGGRFVDVTTDAGIRDHGGRGLGVVAADLDGDDKVDLFVANDQSANYFFRNLRGFRFEEIGHAAGVAANAEGGYQAGMGVACGDLDGDGQLDMAVTNFYGESTTLFQNLGGGLFSDRTAASGLAVPSRFLLGFGTSFLDVDNDGHLDLMTANGHLDRLQGTPYMMPVQLLLGDGSRLRDWTSKAGEVFSVPRIGRALAVGDLDNDGRIDALVLDHKAPLAYLHNVTTQGGHFVSLRLAGTHSSHDAVGVRVVVVCDGQRVFRSMIGGGSYQSASDSRLHIGVGAATVIDRLEVVWPSGTTQRFTNLAVDQGYLLREGETQLRRQPGYTH
jgi:tetratricopeptide (TPR) repeat protein